MSNLPTTNDQARAAVYNACKALGRSPGTYTALGGTVTLVITETGSGIHADYWNGFAMWGFDFLNSDFAERRVYA